MRRAYRLTWVLSIATLAGIGGLRLAHAAKQPVQSTEVAKVNGTVITLEDLNQKYHQSLQFYQPKTPSKKGLLDDLIKRELGIQEAKKEGLDRSPDVIEAMNTVLFNALVTKHLTKQFEEINVGDEEAKEFYAKNPEIRTSHIFVAVPPNASAAEESKAKEKIQQIYDDHIKNGKESFAEVAQHWSEGPAASMGGDIDYKMRGTVDPAYYAHAIALKHVGDVSGIVRSQAGFHIIKLTGIHSWDEVDRPTVKRILIEEKQREAFEKYMAQLRANAKVYVHNELIKE